ncbi:Translation initiation factor 2 subunit beta [uncultured archaeon]|nr:Translation initiation factor 2 subunit beta [uncultured archaeon]
MSLTYEKLLDRVYAQTPKKATSGERFERPIAESTIQGPKTYISNFEDIATKLRRDKKLLAKFFAKELATPSAIEGKRLLLNAKINYRIVNEKLTNFINAYVICKECGKPDTHLEQTGRDQLTLVCESCGAKAPVIR